MTTKPLKDFCVADIKSDLIRRTVIVIFAPIMLLIVIPFVCLAFAIFHFFEELNDFSKDFVGVVFDIWSVDQWPKQKK